MRMNRWWGAVIYGAAGGGIPAAFGLSWQTSVCIGVLGFIIGLMWATTEG